MNVLRLINLHILTTFGGREHKHIIISHQTISYYEQKLLHRIDGPARYYSGGTFDWYARGKCISYTMENYVDDIHNVTEHDLLTFKLIYT